MSSVHSVSSKSPLNKYLIPIPKDPKGTGKMGRATVLTSNDCLNMLEEKKRKKDKEAEEKEERKKEREKKNWKERSYRGRRKKSVWSGRRRSRRKRRRSSPPEEAVVRLTILTLAIAVGIPL